MLYMCSVLLVLGGKKAECNLNIHGHPKFNRASTSWGDSPALLGSAYLPQAPLPPQRLLNEEGLLSRFALHTRHPAKHQQC